MADRKIIIWDFDGVIAPTRDFCYEIYHALDPDLKLEDYVKGFDGNINNFKHKHEILDRDFWGRYNPGLKSVWPVPGIEKVIEDVVKLYESVIVSSTISSSIDEFLTKFNLRQFFGKIYGNEVNPSKVEKFKMVFRDLGVGPEHCVFITDTVGDILEAREVGVKSIAVTWGYHTAGHLQDFNPEFVVNNPEEILNAVNQVLK